MRIARTRAPAKLNLGLEILGRRADGYHEIRTVLVMVDLCDLVSIEAIDVGEIRRSGDAAGVDESDDLAIVALNRLRRTIEDGPGARVSIDKQIPIGAGLGGASADAAAALLCACWVWGHKASSDSLAAIAAEIGSDVPFFLNGPCALATGRGTILMPLPAVVGWAVIASPELVLVHKTKQLYAALVPGDFSGGEAVTAVVAAIEGGMLPAAEAMINAFVRPLYDLAPHLREITPAMLAAGAPFVRLSGAGGSHFTLLEGEAQARDIARRARDKLPSSVRIEVAQLRERGLVIEDARAVPAGEPPLARFEIRTLAE